MNHSLNHSLQSHNFEADQSSQKDVPASEKAVYHYVEIRREVQSLCVLTSWGRLLHLTRRPPPDLFPAVLCPAWYGGTSIQLEPWSWGGLVAAWLEWAWVGWWMLHQARGFRVVERWAIQPPGETHGAELRTASRSAASPWRSWTCLRSRCWKIACVRASVRLVVARHGEESSATCAMGAPWLRLRMVQNASFMIVI